MISEVGSQVKTVHFILVMRLIGHKGTYSEKSVGAGHLQVKHVLDRYFYVLYSTFL